MVRAKNAPDEPEEAGSSGVEKEGKRSRKPPASRDAEASVVAAPKAAKAAAKAAGKAAGKTAGKAKTAAKAAE